MVALPRGTDLRINYAQEFELRLAANESNVPYYVFVTLPLEERAAIVAFRRIKSELESILMDDAKRKK